jgi:hypothetical protein
MCKTDGALITKISHDVLRFAFPSESTETLCLPTDEKQCVNSMLPLTRLMVVFDTRTLSISNKKLKEFRRDDILMLNGLQ